MKVAILNITNGNLSGGYKKYLNSLLPHFISNDIEFITALPIGTSMNFDCPSKYIFFYRTSFYANQLKNKLVDFKPDVVFIPTSRYFKYRNIPCINMVRNMEPLTCLFHYNPLREYFKNYLRYFNTYLSTVRSDRTLAVSSHVKTFLTYKWKISNHKIGVVHHGLNNSSELTYDISLRLDFDFIFIAGSIRPARGIEVILHSLPELIKLKPGIKLVIAGDASPVMSKYKRMLMKICSKYGLSEKVFWIGNVSSEKMQYCFRKCHTFIMSSHAEACPNTLLEAMSYKCNIVSTNLAPMREFLKENAFYYSINNKKSFLNAFSSRLTSNEKILENHKKNNFLESKKFTWNLCFQSTIKQLSKVLN